MREMAKFLVVMAVGVGLAIIFGAFIEQRIEARKKEAVEATAVELPRMPINVYEPPYEFTLVSEPEHVAGTEYSVRIKRTDGAEFTGFTNQPERLKVGEVVQVTVSEYAHSVKHVNIVYFVRPRQ
jgi:hypothetical protein